MHNTWAMTLPGLSILLTTAIFRPREINFVFSKRAHLFFTQRVEPFYWKNTWKFFFSTWKLPSRADDFITSLIQNLYTQIISQLCTNIKFHFVNKYFYLKKCENIVKSLKTPYFILSCLISFSKRWLTTSKLICRENSNILRQLPSTEANFERCYRIGNFWYHCWRQFFNRMLIILKCL